MQIMKSRFVWACKNGHIEIVKLLLSDEITNKFGKINIHANNECAFQWACENGHIEVVKLLLSDEITNKFGKIDIHADNECAFRQSCR